MEEMFMQVFECRDWVKAQMRQQVVSYSQSLACTLLADGHSPPPWLLPPPSAAVEMQGNTLIKPYLDLADQQNADGVHHALPETHQRVEQKTLEFDGVKTGSLHIASCSETVNQCKKRVSETVLIEFTATQSLNEDTSSTNSLEVPHYVASSLLQKDTLHSVEANLHEVPHSVTNSLAVKETTHAAETDSPEGPSFMVSPLLQNDPLQCIKPRFLEGPDSVASPRPQKDAIHTAETDSFEGPHATDNCPLDKDTLLSDEVSFLEGPHSMGSLLPEKESIHTSETDSLEEPQPMASPLLEKATLHCVETNFIEGPHSVASLLLEKETGHTSETISCEGPYCIVCPQLDKDPLHTLEHTETLRGPHSMGSLLLEKEPTHTSETDSLEEPHPMASPLLEKSTLHCVETNFLEGPHSMASLLLGKEREHSSETICPEGLYFMVSPQLGKDPLHTVEHTETLRKRNNFSDRSIDESSKILEQHLLEHTETLRGPHSMGSLLLEKEPTHTSETDSLEEPHPMASPLLEKATLHCVETNFLEGPHSMASLLLEKEREHSSETICPEGLYCMVSPQLGKDPLHTVEHTETLRKRNSFSDRSIDESSKILEQQSSECHVLPPPCNDSSVQPAQLDDIASGAPEMFGMPQENMLDDVCRCSSHPLENMLEDDCGHYSRSKLGDAFSRCSLAKSVADLEKHLPKSANDGDVYQNSIVSSGTMINHNDSNSVCATDVFVSAHNKPSQMQSSLAKPSLKFDRTGTVVDTHTVSAALFISNESLQKEPVLDSVNSHPEQSGHAQAKFSAQSEAYDVSVRNNMDESVSPEVLSGASSKSARVLHTAERDSTISAEKCLRSLQHEGAEQKINADSCTAVSDKHTQSPRPSAQHLLRSSGSGEMVTSFKSDVESTDSDLDRSTASGIQVQGNSSCEKIAMNCQSDYVPNASSSTMSPASMDCQDDICDQMETREDLPRKPQPSVCYFLSSSGSRECISLNMEGRSRMASLSDVIRCNSPRMKASLYSGSSPVEMVPRCFQSHSLENDLDAVTNSSDSCSDILSDGDGCCVRKINSCFKYPDVDVKTATVEDQVLTQMDYVAPGSGVSNPENCPSTTSPTTLPGYASDQQSQQACASNESIHEKLYHDSNLELDKTDIDDAPEGQPVSDGAITRQNSDNYADCDESVQQRQSFSIPIPSNSPTIEERAFEAFCDSTKLVNLSSNLSVKYKMNNKMESLSGVYQSLAARFEKLMNRSSLDSVGTKRHDPSYDTNKLGISGKYSLELDGSFLMPSVLTYDSSNANSVQGGSEIPLTPSVEKYSMAKLSGRSESSSECMGSIPEPACFRIDEDSSIAEENENQGKLPESLGRNYSSQGLTDRKTLEYVTSLYQSREKSASLSTRFVDVGRLNLKTTNAYSREPDHHLHLRIDQAIKNPKNRAPLIRKEGKVTQPLHDRASRTGIMGSKNDRHRSEANLEKGCKPSNIVTNMTSFIPLVKQKQQPCVKRDVRVKALEAAEAAKRREEKKQNEREMRKAAAELEREKIKQEREQKQKLVEQKNKMDAGTVTGKRQREDDEKKEKDRKKKCIEEVRKQQKQQVGKMHAANGEKDACRKDSDDKELGKDLVRGVKNQLLPDERTESVLLFIASENNNLKAVVADGRSESSGLQVQESLSDGVDKSYEMSPYEDSDEEDDDDLERKVEVRRRRKLIPSWARKEFLDKILLSNQTLDPREIFARKCSFNLSDVLPVHIPQRRFN